MHALLPARDGRRGDTELLGEGLLGEVHGVDSELLELLRAHLIPPCAPTMVPTQPLVLNRATAFDKVSWRILGDGGIALPS